MISIKIIKSENKMTKTGKPYKALEVEAENETRKVSMWSNFPDFHNLTIGSVFMGSMTKGEKYWDLSYEGADKPRGGAYGAFKDAQIEKVMDKKNESIGKFQDNKELSIKMASTMRMAVDLAIAQYGDKTVLDTLEQGIEKWRAWCWEHWDMTAENITNNTKPF